MSNRPVRFSWLQFTQPRSVERPHFSSGQFPNRPDCQRCVAQFPDAVATELNDGMPNRFAHPSHLAVSAFVDFDFKRVSLAP